jgi:hypothetical protein
MASAAITLSQTPAIIECTTNSALITLDPTLQQVTGVLRNLNSQRAFLKIGTGAPAADGAQVSGEVALDQGQELPVAAHYSKITHAVVSTTTNVALLAWLPDRELPVKE